jgi:HlyD family secretion protein
MSFSVRRIVPVAAALGAGALLVWALQPTPVSVETAPATRGPMRVTVDEEGQTRAHDRFVVGAPVSGRLARIALREGDPVECDQVVAWIHLLPLDPREQAEVIARVQAAQAALRETDKMVERARASHLQARRERERVERLARDGLVPVQTLEQAKIAEITAAKELEAARFRAQAAASEVQIAEAGLMALPSTRGGSSLIEIRSPVQGRILRVLEKSERVVAAGAPLLELGDPTQLEVVVDVLSTDAVRIPAGAAVLLENWGGPSPLRARVRHVEPSAYTKVSALGVEEQRVNVIADLLDPPGPLGDGYRVEARIVIWEAEDVLKVPSGAVFREGESWSVYVLDQGRARRRPVEAGHRNPSEVEIRAGLTAGEPVILHPPNSLRDGMRVKASES